MKVRILDITHRRFEPVLKPTGRSGKTYVFRWNPKLGRYAYETDSQIELDDLMEGAMHWRHTYFSVQVLDEPEPVAPVKKKARRATKKIVPK